ncbi:hypothetical protein [Acidovorax sp. Root219]|uniref:hypothetical protein n=1 Tax=Acidovorax sp. Root219 TaxID=1736493 RepID=UPI00070B84B3|nr:hypothetical protein [Acidovorax sp. Root219]KRC20186.1 hypothetical protein ASE28_28265 [Acidovorax sp. Root219]
MKAINLAIALVVSHASLAAWAGPEKLEIKGLQIGMSEADFKKANPKARCDFSARDKSWDSSVPPRRTCNVPGFTLATKAARDTQFLFYEGRLGSWNVVFYDFHAHDVQQALVEKYGAPVAEGGKYPGVSWKFEDSSMRFLSSDSSAFLFIDSPIQDAWQLKLSEFKRRNAKKDL